MDLYRVPYETLEVNPLTKKEYKDISSDYRKVPVAMLGEEQVCRTVARTLRTLLIRQRELTALSRSRRSMTRP